MNSKLITYYLLLITYYLLLARSTVAISRAYAYTAKFSALKPDIRCQSHAGESMMMF